MTLRLRTIKLPVKQTTGFLATTDVHQPSGHPHLMDLRGAGNAKFLLTGFVDDAASPYNGIFRSYIHFNFDAINALPNGFGDIKVVRNAYVQLFTRKKDGPPSPVAGDFPLDQSYVFAGSGSQVRIHRLNVDATYNQNGDGLVAPGHTPPIAPPQSRWASADASGISASDWGSGHWEEFVSPNDGGETRIRCAPLVGGWLPSSAGGHPLYYYDPDKGATLQRCGDPAQISGNHNGYANVGIVLRAPLETKAGVDQAAEFYSPRNAGGKYDPHLVIVYEPWNPQPDKPRLISPKGSVKPDFDFQAEIPATDPGDPIASVTIQAYGQTQGGGLAIWTPAAIPFSAAWPEDQFLIPNPRTLPTGGTRSWRARATSAAGIDSAWTNWQDFTILRRTPTVTPEPAQSRVSLRGTHLKANWTTPE